MFPSYPPAGAPGPPPGQRFAAPQAPPPEAEPLVSIPLSEDEVKQWRQRIQQSIDRRAQEERRWDILLKEYLPTVKAGNEAEALKVNTHFRNVQTKIGLLFVRRPDIQLTPKGPSEEMILELNPQTGLPHLTTPGEAIPVKQAVLNYYLGPEQIDGVQLMDECLFDILGWAGICAVKVGYRRTTQLIQQPVMGPPPLGGLGMPPMGGMPPGMPPGLEGLAPQMPQPVPQIGPDGQPLMQMVPVPVHEEWYARRFSPKKLLLDPGLHSTRYHQESSWIGQEFFWPARQVRRQFGLTDADFTTTSQDERLADYEGNDAHTPPEGDDLVHGYEVFYKCAHYYDTEVHPQKIYQLVLFEGMDTKPAVHRLWPDQTFDDQGQLTPDSLDTFPIFVGTIRDLADSPFPPADSAFTNSATKERTQFRQTAIRTHQAAPGKLLLDGGIFEPVELDRMKNAPVGEAIFVREGALAQGKDKVIAQTDPFQVSPDYYQTDQLLKGDIDETLGISATQAGAQLETVRSATEIAAFSNAAGARQEKEQSRVLKFYVSLVRAIDVLLMRYMQGEDYVQIVGDQGTRTLVKWNRSLISGKFSYDIGTDSQMSMDTARARQQDLAFYNMVAKDPLVNRIPILQKLAAKFGYDPYKVIADPSMQLTQLGYGGPGNQHQMEESGGMQNAPNSSPREDRNPNLRPQ